MNEAILFYFINRRQQVTLTVCVYRKINFLSYSNARASRICFSGVLTIGCTQPAGLGSTIDFKGDWDSNPQLFFGRNNWASGDSVRPNISIRFEDKIVRQGNFSARFKVSPLDVIHGGERSEVVSIRLANASIDISENFPGMVKIFLCNLITYPLILL